MFKLGGLNENDLFLDKIKSCVGGNGLLKANLTGGHPYFTYLCVKLCYSNKFLHRVLIPHRRGHRVFCGES